MAVGMVAAAVGIVGTVAGMDSARKANNTQQDAIKAQETAAQAQQRLAQEQWDYQKNTYLPKAQAQADAQLAMSKQLTQRQIDSSNFYQGIAGQSFDQAKKSYEFQNSYMDRARAYMDGTMGNTMANQANANVQQGFGDSNLQMQRTMERQGINPNSGAYVASMNDAYNQRALASAGAQTGAQQAARDKAEQMVGIAAGSGAAGFGTGLGAGGLATGANSSAGQMNAGSLNGLNSVASTFGAGMGNAAGMYNGSVGGWNSAVTNSRYSPTGSALSGLGSTLMNLSGSGFGRFGSTSGLNGLAGTANAMMNGSYNANFDGGISTHIPQLSGING